VGDKPLGAATAAPGKQHWPWHSFSALRRAVLLHCCVTQSPSAAEQGGGCSIAHQATMQL